MNYTQSYCKVLLYLGRLFGVTFGGLRIVKRDKRKISLQERINFKNDVRLKVLSYLILALIGLLLTVNTTICLFFDDVEFEAPIQQLLYFTVASIAYVDTLVTLWIAQKSGFAIFEFIAFYFFNIKQFIILLTVIFWSIFSFALMTASDVVFCSLEYALNKSDYSEIDSLNVTNNSSENPMFEFLFMFYYVGMLPTILSFISQISLSLMTFWHLKDFRKKYFASFDYQNIDFNNNGSKKRNRQISENLELNSKEFLKEFLIFRQKFQILDSKLSLVILSKFGFLIVYLLYFSYMTNVAHFRRWLHLTQTLLTLATLIAFCWIHGLPHDASKQLRQDFDLYLAFNQEVGLDSLKTKLILSKSTVGFHLLGVKYDKSIIGPVFAFILSYIVILVQTRK